MDQAPGSPQTPAAAGGPPRCYRHSDRETGITCTRCERPICHECMVDASVGFHCPECVRGGPAGGGGPARRAARPRTLAGGAVAADPRLVTKVLLGLNLAIWLAVLSAGQELVQALELIGRVRFDLFGPIEGVAEGQWYRLLTAAFLHEQPWHIGLNMLSLWWLGPPLEQALGRLRFVALYLLSALGGSALSYLLAAQNQASLGASGAIFGLLGATAVLMRRLNYDLRPVAALLVINLIITFAWRDTIAWQAHIGGLVVGAVVAYGLVHAPRRRQALVQGLTCAGTLVALLVVVWVRTVQLLG
ncbi:rhomboid family intramembrane serine protease [Streptomyces sp. URMC 123]|uniref:rhomboid family intramembrane serine protease n=1 Tax=Streptomyces sp. URMC 123 TaxID=3423403 RepID=UPI003F1D1DB0